MLCVFFFNETATTEIYTLSLTTLFRSSGRVGARPRRAGRAARAKVRAERAAPAGAGLPAWAPSSPPGSARTAGRWGKPRGSGEHTSELQSRQYSVCRLLLVKKTLTLST